MPNNYKDEDVIDGGSYTQVEPINNQPQHKVAPIITPEEFAILERGLNASKSYHTLQHDVEVLAGFDTRTEEEESQLQAARQRVQDVDTYKVIVDMSAALLMASKVLTRCSKALHQVITELNEVKSNNSNPSES